MKAIFRDQRGEESIIIHSTGSALMTTIRGIECSGWGFDALTPAIATDLFHLSLGDICGCTFNILMPVRLQAPDGLRQADLQAEVVLGLPVERGGLDREDIEVSLHQPEFSIRSTGVSGLFEEELRSLTEQLPAGFSLECCITCGLSDYSPAGQGAFGCLACFRDVADEYRLVKSKADIFRIWKRKTDDVQETHYCPHYESRPKGRGYRG
ncbi:DUF6304 family protein [Verrucomicrobium sp. BvORR034]|uniref:DUF6304 family protein n=1 Tax=Verrucomicrobium sp. BvORR034 TaxID=1396418 RepID=UPI002240FF76|nr:DUF6304 family protein [Verrucomicrobium sp. BvORR034]